MLKLGRHYWKVPVCLINFNEGHTHTHSHFFTENAKRNQGEKLPIIAKQLENVNQSQLGMRRVAKEKGTKSATRKIGKSPNDNGQKKKKQLNVRFDGGGAMQCSAVQCKFFQLLFPFFFFFDSSCSRGAKPLGNFINNKLSDLQNTHI